MILLWVYLSGCLLTFTFSYLIVRQDAKKDPEAKNALIGIVLFTVLSWSGFIFVVFTLIYVFLQTDLENQYQATKKKNEANNSHPLTEGENYFEDQEYLRELYD